MRQFSKYLTWFLFGLAVLGGIGQVGNFFRGEEKQEEVTTIEENREAESLAKIFAKDWLTIPKGQTATERKKYILKYFSFDGNKWVIPTVSQLPRDIQVKDIKKYPKDKLTIITLDVILEIQGTVQTQNGENPSLETQNQKRFYLEVSLKENGSEYQVMAEPIMLPAPRISPYEYRMVESEANGQIVELATTFIKNFSESYFKGKTVVDIQPYLAKGVNLRPLEDFEPLVSVDKILVYSRGQNDEKKPTEKFYVALVQVTVQDPDTKIQYPQRLRVYFTEEIDNNGSLLVTYVLRN